MRKITFLILLMILVVLFLGSVGQAAKMQPVNPEPNGVVSASIAKNAVQKQHITENAALTAGGLNFSPGIKRVCGFQDDETWTPSGAGVTCEANSTNIKHGDRSLHVYCPNTISGSVICTLPIPITLRSGVGFWVKFDQVSLVSYFAIRIYEDTTGTKFHQYSVAGYGPTFNVDNAWQFIWIPKNNGSGWSTNNTPAEWGTTTNPTYLCKRISFAFIATGGNINFWLGDVIAQDFPKAGIVLGFDGPYSSVYDVAYPAMKARGWRGVLWCVTHNMGESGYMNAAQIQELYNAGWDVCSHLHTGIVLTDSNSTASVRSDIERSIKVLRNNGWYRGVQFTSWMGNSGKSLPDAITGESAGDIAMRYFLGCRASSEFTIPANKISSSDASWYSNCCSLWVPPNWHSLPFYGTSYSDSNNFATTMQGFVDLTIAMHEVLNTYTHRIIDPNTASDVSTGFFSDMIAYLDTKAASGEIEIITMTEWYDRIMGRNGAYQFDYNGDLYINTGNTNRRGL
jgi:hypothetical protein